ncbi:MAG TPA: hypothetical protein VIK53_01190 [Verrucomicrobiae bacterium]
MAAVEGAIKTLNDLPPASQMVLTNYPFISQQINYVAETEGLFDLKSQTLSLLVEHLGLAAPTRNVFVLKQWTTICEQYASQFYLSHNSVFWQYYWPDWFIPDFIGQFNFDPITLQPSQYVNEILYSAYVNDWYSQAPYPATLTVQGADPYAYEYTAVAEVDALSSGQFFFGLTYDDVGGLCYLLSTNTVNYETLLPGVSGVGVNSNSFVNGAWRPGVDKITFVPQLMDSQSGAFLPMTNYFTDTYITNGNAVQQQLQRIITKPDFLFSAGDTGNASPDTPFYYRTGTSNWINNASANGNIGGEGPGVIQPPVQIIFNKMGQFSITFGAEDGYEDWGTSETLWASFDGSSNAPVIYPIPQTGTNQMTVRMWLEKGTYPTWSTTRFEWKPVSAIGTVYAFQTATNLTDWISLFTVTNDGTICAYGNVNPASPTRFYRLVPQ